MAQQEVIYTFTGRIVPHWIKLDSLKINAKIEAAGDCPDCSAEIEVKDAHISGRVSCTDGFINYGTLWNVIESQINAIMDVVGFCNAAKLDSYVDSIRDESKGVDLYLDSINHELAKRLVGMGVTFGVISKLMANQKYAYHLRNALYNARLTLTNPSDTALYGYRAIETFMNFYVDTQMLARGKDGKVPDGAWQKFREHYKLSENALRRLADLSKPLRHGNYRAAASLDGATRTVVLNEIWDALGKVICKEAGI